MRLPNAVQESRAWRIRDIASDFTVEDVSGPSRARRRQRLPDAGRQCACCRSGQLPVSPGPPALARPRSPRQLVRPRPDLGPHEWRPTGCGQAPDSRYEPDLTDRPPARRPSQHSDGYRFRLDAARCPLPHGHRICRRAIQPNRARRDAPGLGRPGLRPLPRADGRVRQAAWSARKGLHAVHQAVPPLDCLSSVHTADRKGVEGTHSLSSPRSPSLDPMPPRS